MIREYLFKLVFNLRVLLFAAGSLTFDVYKSE